MKKAWWDTEIRRNNSGKETARWWSCKFGSVEIIVMNCHVQAPGEWVVTCTKLGIDLCRLEGAESLKQAKELAINQACIKFTLMFGEFAKIAELWKENT